MDIGLLGGCLSLDRPKGLDLSIISCRVLLIVQFLNRKDSSPFLSNWKIESPDKIPLGNRILSIGLVFYKKIKLFENQMVFIFGNWEKI